MYLILSMTSFVLIYIFDNLIFIPFMGGGKDMNDYQLGFTHACKLIRVEMSRKEIPPKIMEIIDFVEEEEIEAIKRGIGI